MNVKIDPDRWQIEPQEYSFVPYNKDDGPDDDLLPDPRVNVLLPGTTPKSQEQQVDTIWLKEGKLDSIKKIYPPFFLSKGGGSYRDYPYMGDFENLLPIAPGKYSDDPTLDRLIKEAKENERDD